MSLGLAQTQGVDLLDSYSLSVLHGPTASQRAFVPLIMVEGMEMERMWERKAKEEPICDLIGQ